MSVNNSMENGETKAAKQSQCFPSLVIEKDGKVMVETVDNFIICRFGSKPMRWESSFF